jgi:hypothetical protein
MAETYYIENDNKRDGPYLLDALRERLIAGKMTEKTLVWKEGMADWEEARKVAAFEPFIAEARAEARKREAEAREQEAEWEWQKQEADAARRAQKAEQERQAEMAARRRKLEKKKAAVGTAVKLLVILAGLCILAYVFARSELLDIFEEVKEAVSESIDEVKEVFSKLSD